MRKAVFLIICLLLVFVLISCTKLASLPDKDGGSGGSVETNLPEITKAAEATPADTQAGQPTETAVLPSAPAETSEGPSLYSSYAHMVSFDPAVGTADFDYFDLLQGKKAVKWLVEHEGYTQAQAEAEVADYADSEFIEKNLNTQLRTIDLKNIPVTLMFDPSTGDMLDVAHPLKGSLTDLYKLYEHDHDLVLKTFFYWIKVENGKVVSVEQVYWP